MLVDNEAVLLGLKAVLMEKKSHGRDTLLAEIARLEVQHRIEEGVPERALRLYGVVLSDDLLSPTAQIPSAGSSDGGNDRVGLDPTSPRSKENTHVHAVPVGV